MTHSALYRGELVHARTDELAQRAFRYGVYMAALDLDELETLDRELHLFSRDRRNLFEFRDRDYRASTSAAQSVVTRDLREELVALRAANDIPAPATSRFVTNLRAFGYLFNPVSFCIDYDARGAIQSVIAEVNNTYGGSLRYVLGPQQRTAENVFVHHRELYVSPFLHGDATYEFAFDVPLDANELAITMRVTRDAKQIFFARFSGARDVIDDRALVRAAVRYPFMTARVITLIHWQAMKLRFLAGVPYRRPGADHRPLAL
ncbi:MAG: DUF1365 domain-containing protein [Kofleriaceae bacterium]